MILACLVATVPAAAAARKKPVAKKTTTSKTVKKTSGKRVASKGKTSKSRRIEAIRRAPRQSEPTPERYIQIQQALIDKGIHPGPATGEWGPEWVVALKQFQQTQNLNPDGKLGALSLIALGLGPKREPLAQVAGKPEPLQ